MLSKDCTILRYVPTTPNGRALFDEHWANDAHSMVSLFWAAFDTNGNDAGFGELVQALRAGCPDFDGWWDAHDMATPESGSTELRHPMRGPLRFSHTTLQANDDSHLRLVVYLPRP